MSCAGKLLSLLFLMHTSIQGTSLLKTQVAPDKNTTGCFGNPNCVGFSTFLQDTNLFLTNNSAIELYPGLYTAKTTNLQSGIYTLIISGLENLVVHTANSNDTERAKFICNNEFKLSWLILFSRNVQMENIEMIECGVETNVSEIAHMKISPRLRPSIVILLVHSTSISIENIHIVAKKGSAITSVNTAQSLHIVHSKINGSMDILYSSTFLQDSVTDINIESSVLVLEQRYQSVSAYLQQYTSQVNYSIYNLTIWGGECLYSFDTNIDHCTLHAMQVVQSTFLRGGLLITSKSENC